MTIELNWESKQLLWVKYQDMVYGQELLDTTLALSGDRRFEELRYILSDWSEIKKTNISTSHVTELAAYIAAIAETNQRIKNATVTSKDEAGQSLAVFYQHLTEEISWDVDFFSSALEAREWFDR
ncbi:MAG: hypothetical protein JKX83_06795 [Pseudomonadales bacterium]|nr:hypothetical protein [Pseudomonadales bacterium]